MPASEAAADPALGLAQVLDSEGALLPGAELPDLSPGRLIELYETMTLMRAIDLRLEGDVTGVVYDGSPPVCDGAGPGPTQTATPTATPTPEPTPTPIFADVPADHWARAYIEALYLQGYLAGCSQEPLLYCPEQGLTRAEMAVFVERGDHGGGYLPPEPISPPFQDVALGTWSAKWVDALRKDGYTAGCSADPPLYCPDRMHTRAEATVFFERMLHGPDFYPNEPSSQEFSDVPIGPQAPWYGPWVYAANADGLLEPCEDEANRGDSLFRPLEAITRAEAACMLAHARGLQP